MKEVLVFSASMMLVSLVSAQKIKESDVPSNVRATLQKVFPAVTKAKWNKEEGNYEAEFNLNKEETSVLMDASGKILETEIEIETNQLPSGITEYIKSNFGGLSIREAAKITDSNGRVTFEAEIKGKDLIFDSQGKFISEKKK